MIRSIGRSWLQRWRRRMDWGRGYRRSNNFGNGPKEPMELLVRRLTVPVAEIGGLQSPEPERRPDGLEQQGHEPAIVETFCRFVADEPRRDRRLGPEHDDAAGGIELLLDVVAEILAVRDAAIPPDVPAARCERRGQEACARLVLASVAQE